MSDDVRLLIALQQRINGRVAKPLRKQWASITVRRDPCDVALRFLRLFAGGDWHRGGSHVARYHGGPGIGFPGWSNDRAQKIQAVTIRVP